MLVLKRALIGLLSISVYACIHGSADTKVEAASVYKVPSLSDEQPSARKDGSALRFATAHAVELDLDTAGVWRRQQDRWVWELKIETENATSLNFAFEQVQLSAHAQLEIIDAEGDSKTYTAQDNKPHGQLWTAQFQGSKAWLRLSMPLDERAANRLRLMRINQGF